ncbi:hypothetical protein ETAA8_52680 [Anatilimnocola aggregata]|uniref:Uncharacterized protein n=1 Tax=Anatilimnocola aggregata TaxID=2528021 RepID=A0A517YIV4_9BACT|nr:hypothetical protein [Anatilimnocola aggregata]QDU30149.1 hypothetical protein ETAA8_52680 [Anatilimnocola aggregata]
MPIDVTCANCKTRFQVSEKFAGKKGPCPKCKTVITVPTVAQQVVVHAPEPTGPKDSKGQAVLKPVVRTETKLSKPMIIGIVASVFVVLLLAFLLRLGFPGGKVPLVILITGSVLLAPPLSFAAYTFLRDDELAPFTRQELLLRLIAPSVVYPLIWGLYWFVFTYLDINPAGNGLMLVFAIPVVIVIGAVCAQASLELEFGAAALHYTVYLATTVLLRLILGMSAYWHADPLPPTKPGAPTKQAPPVKQMLPAKKVALLLESPRQIINRF